MIDLAGLTARELERTLTDWGARAFHARQIYRWLYVRKAETWDEMTDLSLKLRARLKQEASLSFPSVTERLRADDRTTRYVYTLADGQRSESVRIPGEPGRVTLCLSSQIGCALACRFCLSGAHGLKRNLTPAEILGQALCMLRDAPPERVNVVFMGIGEPLDNFAAVETAIQFLTDPQGMAIPVRRITVSTAGHVPYMAKLAKMQPRPRLAVSLNATRDTVRSEIMPINKAYPLEQLLKAVKTFPRRRGERVTFEYVLLAGVNDSDEDARRIGTLTQGIPSKINLIPWNPSSGLGFERPSAKRIERFRRIVERGPSTVTLRRERGSGVDAACGQLSFRDRPQAASPPPHAQH